MNKELTKVTNILDLEKNLVIEDGVLKQTPELILFLQTAKSLEAQIKASYAFLTEQMIQNDVRGIKGDWGSLTLAQRLVWSEIDKVAPRFYKKALDTKKVKAYYVAMNKLPKGIDVSATKYLDKKVK